MSVLSDEEKGWTVRFAPDGTQSKGREEERKETRWWEKWREKEKRKEGVQTCGRVSERVRVCTGCGAVNHAAVSCHVSVGLSFFSVRGAVWRRVCGKSPPPCPKGATITSALTARFAHLLVCTCRGGPVPLGTILLPFREFASAECVSLSSRVTRGESSIRLTPPGESSIRLTPIKKKRSSTQLHLWEIQHPVSPCACHKPVARTPSAKPTDVLSPRKKQVKKPENPGLVSLTISLGPFIKGAHTGPSPFTTFEVARDTPQPCGRLSVHSSAPRVQ